MLAEVKRLVALGLKLARGEAVGTPAAEGYFARGVTRNIVAGASAADARRRHAARQAGGPADRQRGSAARVPAGAGAASHQDAGGRHDRARHRRRPRAARQPRCHRGAERHALRGVQHRGQDEPRRRAVRQPASRVRHDLGEAGPAPAGTRRCGARARAERRDREAPRDGLLHRGRRDHTGPQRARWDGRSRRSCAQAGVDAVILTST